MAGAGKRDSRGRTSSITSNGGIFGAQDEQGLLQFSHGLFDDNGGVGMGSSSGRDSNGAGNSASNGSSKNAQVEMNAYENMAKSLSAQKSKPTAYSVGGASSSSSVRASPVLSTSSHMSQQQHGNEAFGRPPSSNSHMHQSASSSSNSHMHHHTMSSGGGCGGVGGVGGGGGGDPSREPALYNAEGIDATPSAAINHLAWIRRVEGSDGKLFIGAYSPEQRKKRIERFVEKRSRRVWTKKVKYDVSVLVHLVYSGYLSSACLMASGSLHPFIALTLTPSPIFHFLTHFSLSLSLSLSHTHSTHSHTHTQVRKNFADSRLRVKGRFVKKEDEEIMRELMTI